MQKSISQLGRSMIEMLGVLAIIGVLSVGGIAGYSKAMTKFKTNKTIAEVTTVVSNIIILSANQKNLDFIDVANTNDLYTMGIIPEEMIDISKDNPQSPFGEFFIYPYSSNTISSKSFSIYLYDLPRETCIALGTYDWGGKNSGFDGILTASQRGMDPEVDLYDCAYGNDDGENTEANYYSNRDGAVTACRRVKNLQIPLTPELAAKGCSCTSNTCLVGILYIF